MLLTIIFAISATFTSIGAAWYALAYNKAKLRNVELEAKAAGLERRDSYVELFVKHFGCHPDGAATDRKAVQAKVTAKVIECQQRLRLDTDPATPLPDTDDHAGWVLLTELVEVATEFRYKASVTPL